MSRDNFFWSGLSRTHYYLIVAQLQRQSLISENIYLKHTMVESENGDIPFEWLSGDLINWLKQLPGANINPKIQLVDLRSRGAGRGVVATADIASDVELFTIPLTDVLSGKTSSLSKTHLGPTLEQLDQWLALTLVLLFETGQGNRSHWAAYLNILPTTFDTLMHWSSPELEELRGCAVLDKIGKAGAEKAFTDQLLPIIKKNAYMFPQFKASTEATNVDTALMKGAHTTATLIMAYAFDLEEEQEDNSSDDDSSYVPSLPKGMVPLADMFNADGDRNNAHLIQSGGSLSMVTLKPVKQGEEIFNDYGQLPRSDLLRRYGYVTDSYKQWDVVEIDAGMVVRVLIECSRLDERSVKRRIQLAQDWGLYLDSFELGLDQFSTPLGLDKDLCLFVDALTMDPKTLQEEIKVNEVPEEPRFTYQMGLGIRKILLERLKSYKSTMAEDAKLLQEHKRPRRLQMAIEVRSGEKEIIAEALDALQRQMTEMFDENGCEVTNEPHESEHAVHQAARAKKRKT